MKKTTIITILILITIIIVSIIYNTLPRLQLNGSKTITISYREKYIEPGVIIKNASENYMNKIKITNNIDTSTLGTYNVDYKLKIAGKTLHIRRYVKVIDDINPVIKLNDDQIIEISINQEYIEPGYTAIDEYDGDLTSKVEITGQINNEKYGEYILKYQVQDNSGNKTEVNRIIKVIDEIKPTIECKKEYTQIKKGTKKIVDCEATDNYDGNITNKIEIIGKYDINKIGTYDVELKVKDNNQNEIVKKHKIIITE